MLYRLLFPSFLVLLLLIIISCSSLTYGQQQQQIEQRTFIIGESNSIVKIIDFNNPTHGILYITGYLCKNCSILIDGGTTITATTTPVVNVKNIVIDISVDITGGSNITIQNGVQSGSLSIFMNKNEGACPSSRPQLPQGQSSPGVVAITIDRLFLTGKSSDFAVASISDIDPPPFAPRNLTTGDVSSPLIKFFTDLATQALLDLRLSVCDYSSSSTAPTIPHVPFQIRISSSIFDLTQDQYINYGQHIGPFSVSSVYVTTDSPFVMMREFSVTDTRVTSRYSQEMINNRSNSASHLGGITVDWTFAPGLTDNQQRTLVRAQIIPPPPLPAEDFITFNFRNIKFEFLSEITYFSMYCGLRVLGFEGRPEISDDPNLAPKLRMQNVSASFVGAITHHSKAIGFLFEKISNFHSLDFIDTSAECYAVEGPGRYKATGSMLGGYYISATNILSREIGINFDGFRFNGSGTEPYSFCGIHIAKAVNVLRWGVNNFVGKLNQTLPYYNVYWYRFTAARWATGVYGGLRTWNFQTDPTLFDWSKDMVDNSIQTIIFNNTDFYWENCDNAVMLDFDNITAVNMLSFIFDNVKVHAHDVPNIMVIALNNTWVTVDPAQVSSPPPMSDDNTHYTTLPANRPTIVVTRNRMRVSGASFSIGHGLVNLYGVKSVTYNNTHIDFRDTYTQYLPTPHLGFNFSTSTVLATVAPSETPGFPSEITSPDIWFGNNVFLMARNQLTGIVALRAVKAAARGVLIEFGQLGVAMTRVTFSGTFTFDSNLVTWSGPAPSKAGLGALSTYTPTILGATDATFRGKYVIRNETYRQYSAEQTTSTSTAVKTFPFPFFYAISPYVAPANRATFAGHFISLCPYSTYLTTTIAEKTFDSNLIKSMSKPFYQVSVIDDVPASINKPRFLPFVGDDDDEPCIPKKSRTRTSTVTVSSTDDDLSFTVPKTRTSRTATYSPPVYFCSPDVYISCRAVSTSTLTNSAESLYFRHATIECNIRMLPSSELLFNDSARARDRFVVETPLKPFYDFAVEIRQSDSETLQEYEATRTTTTNSNNNNGVDDSSSSNSGVVVPYESIQILATNTSLNGLRATITLSIDQRHPNTPTFNRYKNAFVDIRFVSTAFQCKVNASIPESKMQAYNTTSVMFTRALSAVSGPIAQAITGTGTAAIAVSALTAGTMSPGALGLQRMVHLQTLFTCSGAGEPFEILDSPLQLSIGTSPARHALGALVGNCIIHIIVIALTFAVAAYRQQKENVKFSNPANLDAARIPAGYVISSILLLCGCTVGFIRVVQMYDTVLEVLVAVVLFFTLGLGGVYLICNTLLPSAKFWKSVRYQNPHPDLLPENLTKRKEALKKSSRFIRVAKAVQMYLFCPDVLWVSVRKRTRFVERYGSCMFDDVHPDVYYAHLVDIGATVFISILEGIDLPDSADRTGCEVISYLMCLVIVSIFIFTLGWKPWNFRHQTIIALLINGLSVACVLSVAIGKVFPSSSTSSSTSPSRQQSGGGAVTDRGFSDSGGGDSDSNNNNNSNVAQILFLVAMCIGIYDMIMNLFTLMSEVFVMNLKTSSRFATFLREWLHGNDLNMKRTLSSNNNMRKGLVSGSNDDDEQLLLELNPTTNAKYNNNNNNNNNKSFAAAAIIIPMRSKMGITRHLLEHGTGESDDDDDDSGPSIDGKRMTRAERQALRREGKKIRDELERELLLDDDDAEKESSSQNPQNPQQRISTTNSVSGGGSSSHAAKSRHEKLVQLVEGKSTTVTTNSRSASATLSVSKFGDDKSKNHQSHDDNVDHSPSPSSSSPRKMRSHRRSGERIAVERSRSRSQSSNKNNGNNNNTETASKMLSTNEIIQQRNKREEILQDIIDQAKLVKPNGNNTEKNPPSKPQTTTTTPKIPLSKKNSDLTLQSAKRQLQRYQEI